jgi:hypothetical protein
MTDIEKIAETLGIARMRYEMLAAINTSGESVIERTKMDIEFSRARRDLIICEIDLREAIGEE